MINQSVVQIVYTELIDTLWNVNTYEPPAAGSTDKELIDTLWNVNSAAALIVELRSKGINRYIMECK